VWRLSPFGVTRRNATLRAAPHMQHSLNFCCLAQFSEDWVVNAPTFLAIGRLPALIARGNLASVETRR
jgi:hypothetical protein